MALTKPATEILSVSSFSAGGSTLSSSVDLTEASQFALTVSGTFAAGAGTGVVVKVYSSPGGTVWDTVPVGATESGTFQVSVDADNRFAKSCPIWPDFKYVRAQVFNNDGSNTISGLKLTSLVQTVSPT